MSLFLSPGNTLHFICQQLVTHPSHTPCLCVWKFLDSLETHHWHLNYSFGAITCLKQVGITFLRRKGKKTREGHFIFN